MLRLKRKDVQTETIAPPVAPFDAGPLQDKIGKLETEIAKLAKAIVSAQEENAKLRGEMSGKTPGPWDFKVRYNSDGAIVQMTAAPAEQKAERPDLAKVIYGNG